jgi:peptidoglycan/LPS O-acetylase OafA/YrhL
MANDIVIRADSTNSETVSSSMPGRLYYLDWLRVILLFGVFLYHVLRVFDPLLDWHIANAVKSDAVLSILLLINPWGIPLFFLVAGAGTLFSLKRRSNRRFISERVNRLLIPFIIGAILLTPFQRYLEALHFERYEGSFFNFFPKLLSDSTSGNLLSPVTFGRWGLHLWFLAFLFVFSLLALPIFNWFKRDAGRTFVAWLGTLVEKRGGILLFVIPLTIARILVQPFSPVEERGWLDFVYFFLFFILGYIFYSDERFVAAVSKDRWLLLGSGVLGLIIFFGVFAAFGDQALEWGLTFVLPWSVVLIFAFTLMSWGWALFALYLAMRYLNFSNKLLAYGNETILPFYLLHQPVIIVISYFVVQLDLGILVKLLLILVGSLVVTLGFVELLIKPFTLVRRIFGMKPRKGNEEVLGTSPT